MLARTLKAAAGMIAPVFADVAVTSARRLLQHRNHRLLVASLLRPQPPLPPGNFPGQTRHRKGRIPDMPDPAGSRRRFNRLSPRIQLYPAAMPAGTINSRGPKNNSAHHSRLP